MEWDSFCADHRQTKGWVAEKNQPAEIEARNRMIVQPWCIGIALVITPVLLLRLQVQVAQHWGPALGGVFLPGNRVTLVALAGEVDKFTWHPMECRSFTLAPNMVSGISGRRRSTADLPKG
jgi:hypothetical protein